MFFYYTCCLICGERSAGLPVLLESDPFTSVVTSMTGVLPTMTVNLGKRIDIDESVFGQRADLNQHLAHECFVALARHPHRELIADRTRQRRTMKSGFLLAISYMLSRRIADLSSKSRIGIIFPPGLGGYIANLAVMLAGKVPVNLNFTLGAASAEACMRKAEIDCLLTTRQVQQKMPLFPWPESGVVDLLDAMKALPKAKTLGLLGLIYLVPGQLLARWLKVPSQGGEREAGLLFTSGSSGEPKGVVLTHRNILSNCAQIDASGLLPRSEKIIANLPIFHSFGFTVTLWFPLLRGCEVVTLPSPLEVKRVAEAVEAEGATILVGTPTFFKPYLKRVAPEQLATLKYVVAGAEKTPEGFADAWEARFGGLYLEGYGLTETSPVVSVNLPSVPTGVPYPGDSGQGCRRGSVGRLLPGQAARILNPDTMEDMDVSLVGLLALKGANVFGGYLNEPERSAEVKLGDWFVTGDLARFDADGFLFIEGRLSRFSKIAGEMVPHGTVEEALIQAYDLLECEVPMLAVAGRPDAAKGEVLVLIAASELELELNDVRDKLIQAGFSNLWIPKVIKEVDHVPTLVTGKLDLRAVNSLAQSED
ncbi:AMP-binding protein [Coraliomargarita sp. SDUM461004]|uniref:AMP-binding protein n=1 Tax=Thalassobacterium sedimentorum TaxID=3041258 RepID=A0ABU1AI69_9BACT|nr:AMP-binding protein [Coraliomargarita sp. SDUM461004]MDQ8194461.1 AMP-binding protein [Coraliomargarita sp. SDUM461004]